MSTKAKTSKYKNAVAASSSSFSSSPQSSSRSMALTIPEANALQALHQEHLARLSSTTLPNLASFHSQRFLNLARHQIHTYDAMWTTLKLQSVQYRKALWAEDVECETLAEKGKEEGRIVPDFYHKHNGRCTRCALPLVPGLNQVSKRGMETSSLSKSHAKSKGGVQRRKTRKRTSYCTLCHHKFRIS